MPRPIRFSPGLILGFLALGLSPLRAEADQASARPIVQVTVDARDILRRVVVSKIVLPAKPGPTTLHFPKWVPIWGGDEFVFFRPIFNLADASISTGVITILVFQKKFFKPH